jgi:hypothetical protein
MCGVSFVMDKYNPLLPYETPAEPPERVLYPPHVPWSPPLPPPDLAKLIQDFREEFRKAREEDLRAKAPDCADPEKTKLLARVEELERRLTAIGLERRDAAVELERRLAELERARPGT